MCKESVFADIFCIILQAVFGRSTHVLVAKNGHTNVQQRFTFRAEASRWIRTFTFTLSARTTGI